MINDNHIYIYISFWNIKISKNISTSRLRTKKKCAAVKGLNKNINTSEIFSDNQNTRSTSSYQESKEDTKHECILSNNR